MSLKAKVFPQQCPTAHKPYQLGEYWINVINLSDGFVVLQIDS